MTTFVNRCYRGVGEMEKDIPLEKRIIFALDVGERQEAEDWVKRLEPHLRFFKVGLQLFLACGFGIVEWILERGSEVMLDLKLFDVPATVERAIEQIRGRGITFTTVHGNDEILRAAVRAKGDVKVLAVTVLTSLDEADLRDLGFRCSAEELVLSRARRALQLGCDGVISSGLEVPLLRRELGEAFYVVTPGIRPVANREVHDQKRVVGVKEAFLWGADHIVVGRPIRLSPDPEKTVVQMLQEAEEALGERKTS